MIGTNTSHGRRNLLTSKRGKGKLLTKKQVSTEKRKDWDQAAMIKNHLSLSLKFEL